MDDEPTADVVRDPDNCRLIVRMDDGKWRSSPTNLSGYVWKMFTPGPLVPMVDAERPEGVPDWAIPLIRWFWADEDGGGPYSDGEVLRDLDQYPRPPAPEPTLVEQARERAAIRRVNLPGDADLLDALADELETR